MVSSLAGSRILGRTMKLELVLKQTPLPRRGASHHADMPHRSTAVPTEQTLLIDQVAR